MVPGQKYVRGLYTPLLYAMMIEVIAMVGCQVDDEDPCRAPANPCDISEAECRRVVFELTGCIRDFDSDEVPPVRLITSTDFVIEEYQHNSETLASGDLWNNALRMLGLLGSGASAETAKNLAKKRILPEAYYSTESGEIVIIKKRDRGLRIGMEVLAHEFTHFIQNRLYVFKSLEEKYVNSFDSRVSILSLEEGDAEATSKRVGLKLMGTPLQGYDWEKQYQLQLTTDLAVIAQSSSPFLVASIQTLPYVIGARYVEQVWEMAGRPGVEELFSRPPTAFIDWVLTVLPQEQTRLESLQCYPPMPPESLSLFDIDSLGVAGAIAMLSDQPASAEAAIDGYNLASSLVGDSIAVYATLAEGDALAPPMAVVWRTRWSSAEVARSVEQRIQAKGLQLQTRIDDRELLIVTGDTPSHVQNALLTSTTCTGIAELKALLPGEF